ncbi:hypothetical protein GWK08_06310 [Leptobacterium flavescens]|uniref:HTH luxR-type domain-containing protein n=1 Tax=Leptobacterium flavescens TaxID=472055 RepID=A0A6P0UIH1_9FLAO|nr:helix-turn-helix domain-containing protein [Leptobacterium flavescens]NER13044.1 hypothetical protein [Leptobacterium flavescens]
MIYSEKKRKIGGVSFTNKQIEFLRLFASGYHMADIMRRMKCSTKSISYYKTLLKSKLNAANDFEIVRNAFRHNILKKEDFLDANVQEIALKSAMRIMSEGKIQISSGKELYETIFEALMSFYNELEYDELLLKMKGAKI